MKYGIFGGSFDPFHSGHLSMVEGALASKAVDKVLVVPAGMSPFKPDYTATPPVYRYFMTKKALSHVKNCEVLPIDLLRAGVSYTIDTVRQIKAGMNIKKDDSFFFLCGTDIIFSLERWYKIEELVKEVTFLIASRPGILNEESKKRVKEMENLLHTRISFFPIDGVNISSSEIKADHIFREMPETVLSFVKKHDLYREDNPLLFLKQSTCEAFFHWQQELFRSLSPKRLLHSLNVGLLCARYAKRFSLDIDKAFTAGVLHDCAKGFPLDRQRKLAEKGGCVADYNDSSIHAPAGAYYAKTHFGIEDEDIQNAIWYHTVGRKGMSGLEKAVFLADKIEPSRNYDDLEEIRALAEIDLDEAVLSCMIAVKEVLPKKGETVHPDTIEAIEELSSMVTNRRKENWK